MDEITLYYPYSIIIVISSILKKYVNGNTRWERMCIMMDEVCCSVLQCVAVCCSVLQCERMCIMMDEITVLACIEYYNSDFINIQRI